MTEPDNNQIKSDMGAVAGAIVFGLLTCAAFVMLPLSRDVWTLYSKCTIYAIVGIACGILALKRNERFATRLIALFGILLCIVFNLWFVFRLFAD